jgi:23S rRNA pseudouridine1911/1915/1917 synthase
MGVKGLRTKWRAGDQFLVRHRDEAIVVVEKRAGILTVPTPSKRGADVLGLLDVFLSGGRRQRRRSVFAVHRLDRPVSGLLVFARTFQARERLIEQFKVHSVERVYTAAVQGLIGEESGTFESFLAEQPDTLRVESVAEERGRRAVTHWRVLERFPKSEVTLVEVTLETGLRNQIRVHFSEAGHPLLGEKKYAGGGDRQGAERLFLHAGVLGFRHPSTGKTTRFDAPLPPDLRRWKSRFA